MGLHNREFVLREIHLPSPTQSATFLNGHDVLEMEFAVEELKES
jgi:hypothetical protein